MDEGMNRIEPTDTSLRQALADLTNRGWEEEPPGSGILEPPLPKECRERLSMSVSVEIETGEQPYYADPISGNLSTRMPSLNGQEEEEAYLNTHFRYPVGIRVCYGETGDDVLMMEYWDQWYVLLEQRDAEIKAVLAA